MPADRTAHPAHPPCETTAASPARACTASATHTTRRAFLATAGLASAAAATLSSTFARAAAFPDKGARSRSTPLLPSVSLLCSFSDDSVALLHTGGLHTSLALRTPAPRAHAGHPTLPVTYVACATHEHAHLPRGSVSALHLDPTSNAPVALSTQPLALHNTRPERLAVSPSGQHLLALSTHGGSVTLLPLAADGRIEPLTHTLRVPGRGPLPSQPRSAPFAAVFHPSAPLVYVTDRGTDSLLVLHITSSPGVPAALTLLHRHPLPPAFAPTFLALTATSLVLASSTSASLLALPLDTDSLPSGPPTLHRLAGTSTGPFLFDPDSDSLLAITHHGDTTHLAHLDSTLSPFRTTLLPGLSSVAQLVLHDRTLLVAGTPHLFALNLDDDPAQPPRKLLANQGTHGLTAFRLA